MPYRWSSTNTTRTCNPSACRRVPIGSRRRQPSGFSRQFSPLGAHGRSITFQLIPTQLRSVMTTNTEDSGIPVAWPTAAVEHRSLRTWPAVVLVILLWATRILPGMLEELPFPLLLLKFMGPAAISALILLWWVGFSRAAWWEKLFGLVGVLLDRCGEWRPPTLGSHFIKTGGMGGSTTIRNVAKGPMKTEASHQSSPLRPLAWPARR